MSRVRALLSIGLGLTSLAGCRGQSNDEPPVLLERNMYDSERYNPESYSQFFGDHRTMRPPVAGAISREFYEDDPETRTGLDDTQRNYVMAIPQTVISHAGGLEKLAARGQERFNIYCAPCHGLTGDGKGMVTCKRDKVTDPCQSRGFAPLPSYQDARIRQMPDGQLFATISHGVRTMPAYGAQVPIQDRWAIVSYVRALELSQMAEAKTMHPEPKQ
ncbi:MAG: cytochrome c [Polyangiaceae bacterium]